MDDRLYDLIESEPDNDLLKYIFCFMTTIFADVAEECNRNNYDLSANRNVPMNVDIGKLVDCFWRLIVLPTDPVDSSSEITRVTFTKVIQFKAKQDKSWKFLLNELQMKSFF